jgi:acyl-CoA thioesterase
MSGRGSPDAPSSFVDQFAIEATDVPGRYRAEIAPAWAAPVVPNGGIVGAVAAGAMAKALGVEAHTLRTLTTLFASQVAAGPVEIDVEVIRRGKRMSHLSAKIRNEGEAEAGHHLMAAFGESRPGLDLPSAEAPEAPDPERCAPAVAPGGGRDAFVRGFFSQLDVRRVKYFQNFEEGWAGGSAEAIRWSRYCHREGPPDVYGLLPLADTMPPSIGQYLGPGHRFFHAPSVDLTFQSLTMPETEWILTRARARWAGDGYASAEIELWDEKRRLVAYATQMMVIRFPSPDEFK